MKTNLIYIVAFLALAAAVQWAAEPLCTTIPSSLSVSIEQLPRDGTLRLYYDTGNGYSENLSSLVDVRWTDLPGKTVFELPARIQPAALRLVLPGQQGDIKIHYIELGYYRWRARDIIDNFMMSDDIVTATVDGETLNIQAVGDSPYFTSVGTLDYVYGYLLLAAGMIRAGLFLISLMAFFIFVLLLRRCGRISHEEGLHIIQLAVVYFTCILLLLPSVYSVLNMLNLTKMPEFTTAEQKPVPLQFNWEQPWNFFNDAANYFARNYAFRDLLIRWDSTLSVRLVGETPVPAVIKGKDGWLFVDMSGSLDDYHGIKRLNQQELQDIKLRWEAVKNYLDNRGVYLLVVFVPNKETIYPEYMPSRLGPPAGSTQLDQVIAEIKTIPGLQYIDLRSIFKVEKQRYPLYYKDDSHWNNLGAFIGYREVVRRLAPRFNAVSVPEIKDIVVKEYAHAGQGLSSLLMMSGEFPERFVYLTTRQQNAGKISAPSLLVFHDSFYNGIKPFFQDNFATVLSAGMWQTFNTTMVENARPDVVCFIIVERNCLAYP